MGLINDVQEELTLREQVIAEILSSAEENKKSQPPRLGLKDLEEQTPSGGLGAQQTPTPTGGAGSQRQRAATARAGEKEWVATGGEQQAAAPQLPDVLVQSREGKQLPAKPHQVRKDGSIVFQLGQRYFFAPANAVTDGQSQTGKPAKIVDASQAMPVGG